MSWVHALASAYRQHDMRREARQEAAQVRGAKRDTAFRRREVGVRAMKEDRTAPPFAPAAVVVVEDDDEVIKTIVTPQALVRPAARRRNQPVVGGARRIVAPSELGAERLQAKARARPRLPVRPVEAEQERKAADRARMIAFPLRPIQPPGTESAGKDERARVEAAGLELSLFSWRCAARHYKTVQGGSGRAVCARWQREASLGQQFHSGVCFRRARRQASLDVVTRSDRALL
jgi:hypothetical protein